MGCGVSKLDPTILKQPRVDEIRVRHNNEQIIKPMILVSNLSFKHFIRENDKSDHEFGDAEGGAFERKDRLVDNPRSPSFRDYCLINVHASIHDEEDPRTTNERTDNAHKDIRGINSNITSRKSIEKNGRSKKWKRLRNALTKNDSRSVKHIWRVNTCYNPNFALLNKPQIRKLVGI